ncbi:ATP-dependent RNA helicase FAL1 [Meyerozyma guilliermondii ATCC 6260] [Rhizoctonia solani]|uniref:ATP-dependent RNA helicase FAL1 [Meyerozyma guilliermondii ATCC 6260] n=1 Tax=Rhizoctonia solani TaxID=456999 RepID=A0A0K6FP60_9AGAM|nr:ATP-dependent RNA helicase FAL1 [Meyerozyma guilliermondii ATCC 6260] [Rhizoctonia solani]
MLQNRSRLLEATMRNVPKLKELNYTQWKNVITNSIKNAKLWEYIDGSIQQPPEESSIDLATYFDEAGAVRNAILGSLESGAQKYIEEALDPRDAWLSLEKKYLTAEADADAKLASVEKQLSDLKLEEGGDMVEHIAEFCRMRCQLHGSRFALDDPASVSMLYRSLPSSYRHSVLTPEGTEMKGFEPEVRIDDTPPAPTEDYTNWGVPEDIRSFGLTGDKNPLLEERAAVTCRDCLLKDHKAGTPECPQYEWRKELWGMESKDVSIGTRNLGKASSSEGPLLINAKRLCYEFSEPIKVILSFDELGLKPDLRQKLHRSPFAVQQCAILPITYGRNVFAQAPSGSGKTTALAVSILQLIDATLPCAQALVFISADANFQKVLENLKPSSVRSYLCYSSNPITSIGSLSGINEHHIFVGTPENLLALISRKVINLRKLKIVALDDLDKLVEAGMESQILEVYRHVPPLAQVVASSTTYSFSIAKAVTKLLADPLQITVNRDEGLSIGTHFYVTVPVEQKPDALRASFAALGTDGVVVLCRDSSKISEYPWDETCRCCYLENSEWYKDAIRDFTNQQWRIRERYSNNYSNYGYSYDLPHDPVTNVALVATDPAFSAARVDLLNTGNPIVHYDIPNNIEDYVKRLWEWRISDSGRSHLVISFVTTNELHIIQDLEQYYGFHVSGSAFSRASLAETEKPMSPVSNAAPTTPSREMGPLMSKSSSRTSALSAGKQELAEWVNSRLPATHPLGEDLSTSMSSGSILFRLAESIKEVDSGVSDSLFDVLLDNDVRNGNAEKIAQLELVRVLKSWDEKRRTSGKTKSSVTSRPIERTHREPPYSLFGWHERASWEAEGSLERLRKFQRELKTRTNEYKAHYNAPPSPENSSLEEPNHILETERELLNKRSRLPNFVGKLTTAPPVVASPTVLPPNLKSELVPIPGPSTTLEEEQPFLSRAEASFEIAPGRNSEGTPATGGSPWPWLDFIRDDDELVKFKPGPIPKMYLNTLKRDETSLSKTGQSTDIVQSSQMTSLDMFQCLINHGCDDLTNLICPEKYSSCRVAEGAFGDIWKGELQDGTAVAVKVLRFALVSDSGGKNLKRMVREIYAWSKLDHENVHKLLGMTIMEGRLGMVSKWMSQGNLRDYLDRNTSLNRYELCVQITKGVEYIHRKGMVHGDIKASNILVSADGVLKLTDFDHSLISECSLMFTATTRVGGGTPRWMAPELFHETSHQSTRPADIYALGMTFLEVITGAIPYSQCINDPQVILKVVQKIFPERSLEHFADDTLGNSTWRLLTRCWDHDPISRPTAQVVLISISMLLSPLMGESVESLHSELQTNHPASPTRPPNNSSIDPNPSPHRLPPFRSASPGISSNVSIVRSSSPAIRSASPAPAPSTASLPTPVTPTLNRSPSSSPSPSIRSCASSRNVDWRLSPPFLPPTNDLPALPNHMNGSSARIYTPSIALKELSNAPSRKYTNATIGLPSPATSASGTAPAPTTSLSPTSIRFRQPSTGSDAATPTSNPPTISAPFSQTPATQWTVPQVIAWLQSRGFDTEIQRAFQDNDITGDVLIELDGSALRDELGILGFGERMRLLKQIGELKREDDKLKAKDRLSIFRSALGKGRKPAPRYHPSETEIAPPEERSHLSLSRLYMGGGSQRKSKVPPSTENEARKRNISGPVGPLRSASPAGDFNNHPQHSARAISAVINRDLGAGALALDQIGEPDYSGWMRKKGDRYNYWKLSYKVIADENVNPGRYGFRIVHDTAKQHFFSSEQQGVIREWIRALMKITILRNYNDPVRSSCNDPTIPIAIAQQMDPAPRPPSPSDREAAQRGVMKIQTNSHRTAHAF